MRRIGLMYVATLVSGVAMGQAPAAAPAAPVASGPAAEVRRSYEGVKKNILKSAELMPAENYAYKPEPDIRIYARVINHISEAQFRFCGIANGLAIADIAKPPADTADKAAIVEALKASFADCDKAFGALTDANIGEMFTAGPGKRSRIGLMWQDVAHDQEQYATLALYLRLKGLVPPSSEK
jgi:ethanolamine utilization microcompartment shell protein EutL